MKISLLTWTKIIVFFDYLAVALVVPLLSSYFRDAGVSKMLFAYISSTYQIAQLFGGVVIGAASDSLSKRSILLLSFVGSAVSYMLVGLTGNTYVLFGSRVLVGLVKQTMTVTTSTISELTAHDKELRARELGQFSAAATLSFVVGPSAGSMLYKQNPMLPCVCAAALFVINIVICLVFFPASLEGAIGVDNDSDGMAQKRVTRSATKAKEGGRDSKIKSGLNKTSGDKRGIGYLSMAKTSLIGFFTSVIDLCKNPEVGFIVCLQILYGFVQNSMSYRHILNYLEDRFNIETYQYGFISSYGAIAGIVADVFLVPLFSRIFQTQNKPFTTITLCVILIAAANLMEAASPTIYDYVYMSMLPSMLCANLVASSMKVAFLAAVPSTDTGKAQGVVGILQSFSGIVAPIYGTAVMTNGSAISSMLSVDMKRPQFAFVHYMAVALFAAIGIVDRTSSTKKSKKD